MSNGSLHKHKRCEHKDCNVQPSYNFSGEIKARYCNEHKTPGMSDIINKRCGNQFCQISKRNSHCMHENTGGTKTIYHFNSPHMETPLNNGPDGKLWIVVQPFPMSKCRWELVSDQQQDCKVHKAKRLKIHHDSSEISEKTSMPKDDILELSRKFWSGIHNMFN